jgi:23S rRNA (cytidine1920-2'-O)/16S rRNA (cytidine1409-2'-O)-methyltransferase
MGARRPRYVNVLKHVRSVRPDIDDPVAAIEQRQLVVGGRLVGNPHSLVPADAPVVLRQRRPLRGERKLEAALDRFGIVVAERTCLDLGASAGGFTRVLLRAGARRVFSVDVGFGQLRGDLRADARVVNLERTNLADLPRALPPDVAIDLVTTDLSYLSIAEAVPQLEPLSFAGDADMVGLVKPMFELGLATLPTEERELKRALTVAATAVEEGGRWRVVASMPSPNPGSKGAREWLLHARRAGTQLSG